MAAVSGMSGHCFEGPVVYVVSGMQNKRYWDQLYAWLVACRAIGAKMSSM